MIIFARFAFAVFVVAAGFANLARAEPPRVVASIAPVHSLVANVMAGIGAPALLIRGFGSPHAYQLRPSEAADLANADVVFWIGRDLETVLGRPLAALAEHARIVALGDIDGMERWPARAGGSWAGGVEGHDHTDNHSEHGPLDQHMWLSPTNASAMVFAVGKTLMEIDPANAAAYRANTDNTVRRIQMQAQEIEQQLAPIRSVPFVVMHDAYQYLERSFGLNAVGAVSLSPDRPPSARRLSDLRERIRVLDAACAFSEPQMAPALLETMIEGIPIKRGILDPLGATLSPGPDAYFAMMTANAAALLRCLSSAK